MEIKLPLPTWLPPSMPSPSPHCQLVAFCFNCFPLTSNNPPVSFLYFPKTTNKKIVNQIVNSTSSTKPTNFPLNTLPQPLFLTNNQPRCRKDAYRRSSANKRSKSTDNQVNFQIYFDQLVAAYSAFACFYNIVGCL